MSNANIDIKLIFAILISNYFHLYSFNFIFAGFAIEKLEFQYTSPFVIPFIKNVRRNTSESVIRREDSDGVFSSSL